MPVLGVWYVLALNAVVAVCSVQVEWTLRYLLHRSCSVAVHLCCDGLLRSYEKVAEDKKINDLAANYFAFISTHSTRRARSCLSNLLVTKLMNDDYIPRNLFQFKITCHSCELCR